MNKALLLFVVLAKSSMILGMGFSMVRPIVKPVTKRIEQEAISQQQGDGFLGSLERRMAQELGEVYRSTERPQLQPLGQAALPLVRKKTAESWDFLRGFRGVFKGSGGRLSPIRALEQDAEMQRKLADRMNDYEKLVSEYRPQALLQRGSPFDGAKLYGEGVLGFFKMHFFLRQLSDEKKPLVGKNMMMGNQSIPSLQLVTPGLTADETSFSGSSLIGSYMPKSTLNKVGLRNTDLTASDLTESRIILPRLLPLWGTNFTNANLRKVVVDLREGGYPTDSTVVIYHTNFQGADIKNMSVLTPPGVKLNLEYTNIQHAKNALSLLKMDNVILSENQKALIKLAHAESEKPWKSLFVE